MFNRIPLKCKTALLHFHVLIKSFWGSLGITLGTSVVDRVTLYAFVYVNRQQNVLFRVKSHLCSNLFNRLHMRAANAVCVYVSFCAGKYIKSLITEFNFIDPASLRGNFASADRSLKVPAVICTLVGPVTSCLPNGPGPTFKSGKY